MSPWNLGLEFTDAYLLNTCWLSLQKYLDYVHNPGFEYVSELG